MNDDLRRKAFNIAGVIADVQNVGDRGILFKLIAVELSARGQMYIAKLFEEAAEKYGMPNENNTSF